MPICVIFLLVGDVSAPRLDFIDGWVRSLGVIAANENDAQWPQQAKAIFLH